MRKFFGVLCAASFLHGACAQAQSSTSDGRSCAVRPDASAADAEAENPIEDATARFWARSGFVVSDEAFTDTSPEQYRAVAGALRGLYHAKRYRLAFYHTRDVDGTRASAWAIIERWSRTYGINPKAIVCTLQKEQSLLTDTQISQKQLDWAMGYGVCDGCSRDQPKVAKHAGFARQVHNAASGMRQWFDNVQAFGNTKKGRKFAPGKTYKIGSHRVSIENAASAVLYTYTPHVRGQVPFVECWEQYFPGTRGEAVLLAADTD